MITDTEFEQLWWDYEMRKITLHDMVQRLCPDPHKYDTVMAHCRKELAKFGIINDRKPLK